MATTAESVVQPRQDAHTNGGELAAFVAAGVGSLAMGLIVVLGHIGALSVPALYAPAGGVTGRTTLAAVVWLVAWAALHRRWRNRDLPARPVFTIALVLIALGVLGTFPPAWNLF